MTTIANTVIVILDWVADHWLQTLVAWSVTACLIAVAIGKTIHRADQAAAPTEPPKLRTVGPWGDPSHDPIGTTRYATDTAPFAWVKTRHDHWRHIGGCPPRTDRQMRRYRPGLDRAREGHLVRPTNRRQP